MCAVLPVQLALLSLMTSYHFIFGMMDFTHILQTCHVMSNISSCKHKCSCHSDHTSKSWASSIQLSKQLAHFRSPFKSPSFILHQYSIKLDSQQSAAITNPSARSKFLIYQWASLPVDSQMNFTLGSMILDLSHGLLSTYCMEYVQAFMMP
jgi:hypothetical protein